MRHQFQIAASLAVLSGVMLACTPSLSLRQEYTSVRGWGWPVDSVGPYFVTVRLNADTVDSLQLADSVVSVRGAISADYVLDSGRKAQSHRLPGIEVDSLCILAEDGSPVCFSLRKFEGSNEALSTRIAGGPNFVVEPMPVPAKNPPFAYCYRARLIDTENGEVVESHRFRHDLKTYLRSDGKAFDFSDMLEYPGPFCPTNKISYFVIDTCKVLCVAFDVYGEVVDTLADEIQAPGYHEAVLDATGLLSGVYFCRISVCDQVTTKKLMLLK